MPRKIDNGYEKNDVNEKFSTEENKDSFEVKPTPPSEKKKTLQMRKDEKQLLPSPSLERLKIKVTTEISVSGDFFFRVYDLEECCI